MKKVLVPIIVLVTLFRSGLLAQGGPSGFDMAFDKKAKEVSIVTCEENGFCVVTELQSRKIHQLVLVHVDSAMRPIRDTVLDMLRDMQVSHIFYEDGSVVMLCRHYQSNRITDRMTVYLYHTASKTLETREIGRLPMDAAILGWHYYHGNLIFSTRAKASDGVWYLPAGFSEPFPFTFTWENPGRLLSLDVDTANGRAVIVFCSGDRTMYFETDFQGKSSFANIIGEPATQAHWIPVNRSHSVLMLYYHDDETFYMHPVNILNHRVTPSDTVFFADITPPKSLPEGVSGKRMIIVAPYSDISFYPTRSGCTGDRIFCVTELYYPEYSNYFNGMYVELRFDGYRYERADVHFFDTNGVFLTNVTFPYGEESPLRTSVYKVLNVSDMPNGDILFYHLDSRDLSAMLLDSVCTLKSPVSTVELPLFRQVVSGTHKIVPGAMQSWYGNRFLLSAYRVNPASLRKVGLIARKMEYN